MASGPSLTIEQCALIEAARVRGAVRVIVVNNTWQRLPNADCLYAADGRWLHQYAGDLARGFCGGEIWTQDKSAAQKLGLRWIQGKGLPGLSRDPGLVHTGSTSGYQAIGLAFHFGARRIILAGYDMQHTGGRVHWHGDHPPGWGNIAHPELWLPKFGPLAEDLKAEGVAVVNCSAATAITAFPRADLAETTGGAVIIPGLTSVVIPAHNAAATLQAAIDSALAQTAPVEVIVIDDGSTDGTLYGPDSADLRIGSARIAWQAHAGVAAARNHGLSLARGEFVQFLDADDTIEPGKIAALLAEMDDATGFVLCDTRIVEASGREQLASERYGYAEHTVNGWIAPYLAVRNFIPVHAPLYRRSAIGDVRFRDGQLEDWHFVHDVALTSRCRYVPEVLCTYRKRRGSRNTTTRSDPANRPGVAPPLRLNLGCGKPGCADWHPIPGFANLDKSLGWRFEDGLGEFADGSVAGITISHVLMYVAETDWPRVFAEFARVLQPGGVVRITEDDATNPASSLYGGWRGSEPYVTLTDAAMTRRYLEAAGFTVHDVTAEQTFYADTSLIQAQHRPAPHSYWIEGVRECSVLFEPHADDSVLFAAFSLIRYRPRIVTCCPSSGDYGDTDVRHQETVAAAGVLGAGPCEQWDGLDLVAKMRALDARIRPTRVFAPSLDTSHPDHVAVAVAAASVFGDRLTRYQTYDASGKVRAGTPVPFEPGWPDLKRRALECYRTQVEHPRAQVFFEWPIDEWAA